MADIKDVKLSGSLDTLHIKDAEAREWIAGAIDLFYPVDSVIINFGVDPGDYLTGTYWERTAVGKAVVGVDDTNTLMDIAGETFGQADSVLVSHTHSASSNSISLTANAGGAHSHTVNCAWRDTSYKHLDNGSLGYPWGTRYTSTAGAHTHSIDAHSHAITVYANGVSATDKNYQPSMAFYIWKRVS